MSARELSSKTLDEMLELQRVYEDKSSSDDTRTTSLYRIGKLIMRHRRELLSMADAVMKARAAQDYNMCPECGPGVLADDDGTCSTCGATLCGDWVAVLAHRGAESAPATAQAAGPLSRMAMDARIDRTIYVFPRMVQCIHRDPIKRWYMCVPTPTGRKHVSLTEQEATGTADWFRQVTAEDHAGICPRKVKP